MEKPTNIRWRIIGLMMAYAALGHFNRMSMAVAGTERIIPRYHVDPTRMGMIYTAFLIVYACLMTPGGWFIDRVGPRWAMAAMGFGGAILAALTGATSLLGPGLVLTGLWIIRPLAGAANAPLHPGAARVVSLWMPLRSMSLGNGLVTAGALVGIAAVPHVFGALIDRFDWPAAFGIAGAVTAVLALAWSVYGRDLPSEHPAVNPAEGSLIAGKNPAPHAEPRSSGPTPWGQLLSHRSLLLLTASYAAVGYVQYLFYYWLEYYFKDVLHVPLQLSRTYTTIASLSMAVGMVLGGLLADRAAFSFGIRRGRALVPATGMIASALLVFLGAGTQNVLAVVALFSLAMAAIGSCEGPFWTTVIEIGGRRGGTAASILNTGGNLGGLLAPVVTPWLGRHFGWQISIMLAGLFSLIGAALWRGIDPTERVDT